jgi:hypothetical protein
LVPKYPDNENDTLLLRGKAYYMAGEKGKAKADIEEYLNRKRKEAETTGLSKIFRIVGINPEDIL